MGIRHEYGYSADVEGFFVTDSKRFRLAKTNDATLVLAEPCELPPGIEGELLIIVDGCNSPSACRKPLNSNALHGEC